MCVFDYCFFFLRLCCSILFSRILFCLSAIVNFRFCYCTDLLNNACDQMWVSVAEKCFSWRRLLRRHFQLTSLIIHCTSFSCTQICSEHSSKQLSKCVCVHFWALFNCTTVKVTFLERKAPHRKMIYMSRLHSDISIYLWHFSSPPALLHLLFLRAPETVVGTWIRLVVAMVSTAAC